MSRLERDISHVRLYPKMFYRRSDASRFGFSVNWCVHFFQVKSEVWANRLPPALAPDSDDMVSTNTISKKSRPYTLPFYWLLDGGWIYTGTYVVIRFHISRIHLLAFRSVFPSACFPDATFFHLIELSVYGLSAVLGMRRQFPVTGHC